VTLAQQPPVPLGGTQPPPPDISKLPLWQCRYLTALQEGLTDDLALQRANVNKGSIAEWSIPGRAKYDPAFAEALNAVELGRVVLGTEYARQRARAYTPNLVEHFGKQATDPAVRPRDQQGAGRFVAEVSQAIGTPPPDQTARETAKAIWVEMQAAYRQALAQEKEIAPARERAALPVPEPAEAPDGKG